jgi:hypothetical protein
MPVALHCVDQPGDHLAESFATDSIGGLPNDGQRFSNGFIVDPRPLSRLRRFSFQRLPQRTNRMLSMKARHLDELVEDLLDLVSPAAR